MSFFNDFKLSDFNLNISTNSLNNDLSLIKTNNNKEDNLNLINSKTENLFKSITNNNNNFIDTSHNKLLTKTSLDDIDSSFNENSFVHLLNQSNKVNFFLRSNNLNNFFNIFLFFKGHFK